MRKPIAGAAALIVGNSPSGFGAQVKSEFEIYNRIVESQKLKLD